VPPGDRFSWDLHSSHWLFTFALGLALGVALAGLWALFRARGERPRDAVALTFSGLVLGCAAVLLVWDASPFATVFLRLRPYLSAALPAAALVGAALGGAFLSLAAVLGARRLLPGAWGASAGVAGSAVLLGLALWGVDRADRPSFPRHPAGTARQILGSTRVVSGLNVPTGLAIAPNGDLAIVELQPAGFRLFSPAGDSFVERLHAGFPIPDGLMAFHVAFHPQYPAQPYVYATIEEPGESERRLQLVRGRIDGGGVTWDPLVTGLPNAQIAQGGNHHGSGIAFCGDYLFLGTGDTEVRGDPYDKLYEPQVVRDEAQDLASLRGKVLRWRLAGAELAEAPAIDSGLPLFAFGFRNPFAVGCDEATGNPIVADNGPGGFDQIRLVEAGSNHEWPLSWERDNLARPLFDSRRAQIAPTGIAQRSAPGGGTELVMSTFQSAALYVLPVTSTGKAGRLQLVAEVEGGAFAVATDAQGCVLFSGADSVWRLEDGRCGR